MRRPCTLGIAALCLVMCAGSIHAADDGWQPRSGHQMVVFHEALFITGGLYAFEKNFFFNDIWTSDDGAVWSHVETEQPYSPQRHLHASLVFQDHLWVMGGQGNGFLNDVWRSADGVQWEQVVAAAPWSPRRGMACVVHNGRMFFMGGVDNTGEICNDVWASEDGATWELVTGYAQWRPRWEHAAVSSGDAIVVIGGTADYGLHRDVWRSVDGVAWTQVGMVPVAVRGHRAEAFKDQIFVFGGVDVSAGPLNQVWSSSDGTQWKVVAAAAPWQGRARHASTVYNRRLWLAGGTNGEGDCNDVWSSRDGEKWTSVSPAASCGCNSSEGETKTLRGFLGDFLLIGVSLLVLRTLRF